MTKPTHGTFCWYENGSRDADKAKAFYAELFGWSTEDTPMPGDMGGTYTMLRLGGKDVGGLYQMEGEHFEGIPSNWMAYIHADDVAASAEKAKSLGATVMSEPMEVPGVGHMAMVRDPQGAVFSLYHGAGEDGVPDHGMAHGSVGWRELATTDIEGAREFYTEMFGWDVKVDAATSGNPYTMFGEGEAMYAGAMAMEGDEWKGVPPHWAMYFTVDDVDATVAKATELGGTVHVPPFDIPNVGRFSVVADPAGATFSVITYVPMEA